MALSTTQYGYIIDPMVPFTDDKGNTIKDGFVRVFVAGSSTPVVTYRNFDGATNQVLIELDNSGRTRTSVIGSKGLTYKVCVYDAFHSQESPILTVDKVSAIGANITAGAGSTIVQGLDNVEGESDGFVTAEVVGTTAHVKLYATNVSHTLNSDAAVGNAATAGYIVPALSNDPDDPGDPQKLPLAWIYGNRLNAVHTKTEISDFADDNDGFLVDSNAGPKFMKWKTLANKVLGFIKSLSTTITAFRTGDVIPVDGPSGTAKMSKDSLLAITAQNAVDSGVAVSQGDFLTLENKLVRDDYASVVVGNLNNDGTIDPSNTSRIASTRLFAISAEPSVRFALPDGTVLANIIRYYDEDLNYVATNTYSSSCKFCKCCAYTWTGTYSIEEVLFRFNDVDYQNKTKYIDIAQSGDVVYKKISERYASVVVGNLTTSGTIDPSNTSRITSSLKFEIDAAPTIGVYVATPSGIIGLTPIIRFFGADDTYIGTSYTSSAKYCMVCAYTWTGEHPIEDVYIVFNGIKFVNTNKFSKIVYSDSITTHSKSSFSNLVCRKFGVAKYDYNIVVCYGQSLSRGFSKIDAGPTEGIDGGLMLGSAQVADTLDFSNENLTRLRMFNTPVNAAPNTPSISAVNSLVYRERVLDGRDLYFIDVAAGASGNTVAQLMDPRRYVDVSTGDFYFPGIVLTNTTNRPYLVLMAALQRIKDIADSESKTCGVVSVLFIHGEGDGGTTGIPSTSGNYSCNGDGEEYESRVRQLFSDMDADFLSIFGESNPAFFIAEVGGDFLFNMNINAAQNRLINNQRTFLLPPSYQVPNQDDGHPTGNGYRWYGEQIGKTLQSVFCENCVPENLTVKDIVFDGKNTFILSFNIPQEPIVLNTWTVATMRNYGFCVVADGNSATILDVSTDGKTIKIITEDLSAAQSIYIEYASEKSVGLSNAGIIGSGNICDSSEGESYFTDVADIATSGSVEYTPVDEKGYSIVGESYPLMNFLHAFSKKVL